MADERMSVKRTILYCRHCKWAAETTERAVYTGACPECRTWGLSFVRFHDYEKTLASDVLEREMGKKVDDVLPYENT